MPKKLGSYSNLSNMRPWFVLLGLMLVYAATNGVIVHSLPLIYPSLIDEFGWSTAQMTLPATVFLFFGAISSPPAGVLLDRFSARNMMLCGAVGLLLSLFVFSVINALSHMVIVFFCFGLSMSLCGLGASMVLLTRWFTHQRGRATGLLLMASSLGGAMFPLIIGRAIESMGWRGAITIAAVIATMMILPSLIFLVKDKSVDEGSNKNISSTEPVSPQSSLRSLPKRSTGPTLRATIKNPNFYLIAFATGSVWFCVVALLQHQAIHLVKDVGVDRALVFKMFSVFAVCAAIGKFSFGWLSDFLNKELSMVLSIATFVVGLIILSQIDAGDNSLLFVYAIICGIGFSGSFTTVQMLIANHFAGASYGKILTILLMIDSLAGALGTRVIATMRDGADSYLPAINTMIAICVLAMVCVFIIRFLNQSDQRGG